METILLFNTVGTILETEERLLLDQCHDIIMILSVSNIEKTS